MTQVIDTDIVIFGGGIAGLWMLNRLRQDGFDAVLLEKSALGCGQTLGSQGIIHGGLKYALSGVLSPASSAISAMPDRWRSCLAGEAEIDLRQCQVLSSSYYMWSTGGYRSRLKTFLGSKALRGRIDMLSPASYPDFFKGLSVSGALYQLTDFVVDTPSLIRELATPHLERIFRVDPSQLSPQFGADEKLESITIASDAGAVRIKPQRFVLSAGEGNAELLKTLGAAQPEMQVRPLHMLAVKLPHETPAYLHCIGDSFGMTPRLTITSHPQSDGSWIWYVGGEIAESGVERSSEAQIAEGQRQLQETFPWIDFSQASWFSFPINRAEPHLPNLQRPDTAFLHSKDKLIVTWPTKLTLTPNLGDTLMRALSDQGITPSSGTDPTNTTDALSKLCSTPDFGHAHWEQALK
jgi:glycine/D-amino acid oxidase-like deaminating enzyme